MAVTQVAVNDIWVCKDQRCAGGCDDAVDLCQFLIYGCAAPAVGFAADVGYTEDGGTTWTNSVDYPFGNGEHVISVVCFPLDSTTTRWLVVRDNDGANPAEIAYSDDGGANWINVDVEAVGTRGALDSGALFALDAKHIWLALEAGYIFFSEDGGLTWTNQDDGTVTAEDYHAVNFANHNDGFAVADNGIVVRTIDGGETWAAVTAITATPNVLCVFTFDKDNVVVGDVSGQIWRSWDGGTTWTLLYTGTSINDIDFVNNYVGWAVDDDAVLRTRNGGEDWEVIAGTPAMTEFNAIVGCDENTAFAVGEDDSNYGAVIKIA